VPLFNIGQNASARRSSSSNRRLGIAFGSIIGVAFLAGVFVFLYLIPYHRPWARARARTWKQQLSLRNLRRRRNNDSGPAVGVERSGRSGDTLADPFDFNTPEFIPPLDVSTPTSKLQSTRGRRDGDKGWRNLEDYSSD
jgi:hypothetical protein